MRKIALLTVTALTALGTTTAFAGDGKDRIEKRNEIFATQAFTPDLIEGRNAADQSSDTGSSYGVILPKRSDPHRTMM